MEKIGIAEMIIHVHTVDADNSRMTTRAHAITAMGTRTTSHRRILISARTKSNTVAEANRTTANDTPCSSMKKLRRFACTRELHEH